ncbi:MAG: hypothetical protein DME26_17505 [Verrucomicrobia bacterium]|nr:MAG: hypothetical protein DME26_17505 [Verrucomicrobiota bacterium]
MQADGKIIIGGTFTFLGGMPRNYLARLNPDGTLDFGFNPNLNNWVFSTALQADGKIIIAGDFTTVGGKARSHLARLNADGTLDTIFNPYTDFVVYSTVVQPDGKVIIGGAFTTVNGLARNRIARLENDAATQSLTAPSANRIEWLRGGASPEAQDVVFDLSTDRGTTWTPLGSGTRITGLPVGQTNGWELIAVSLPTNSLVRGRARVTGGIRNGSSSLVETVAAFPFNAPPTVAEPIANFTVSEDTPSTIIDLRTVFQDAETAAADLLYSVPANRNSTVVSALVDNSSNTLTLDYRTNQFGAATITVRATDAVGLYVEDKFVVTVDRLHEGDPGDVDLGFNPNVSGSVLSTALQTDGRFVVGGLTRLNVDGTLDLGFNSSANNLVNCAAVQGDGKIVIGGEFTTINGTARNHLARLNADGSLDNGFNPNANAGVYTIAVQADGKFVIGGAFTTVRGVARNRIARVNPDGTLDNGFNPNANNPVGITAVQADGKIIIGGRFTTVGGLARTNIARVNANGTLDAGFNPSVSGNFLGIVSTAVQPDGKIVIGGFFTTVGNTARTLARLNADGTLDTSFKANVSGSASGFPGVPSVYGTVVQADGKIVIRGFFTAVGDTPRSNIARLNADGSLDSGFNPDANGGVYSVVLQADGKIVVGGDFTTVGGLARANLARLANDPATQNLTVSSTNRIEWLRGGTSPEAQDVAFELSIDDGSTWISLGSGTRIVGGWEKTALSLPASGLVRGRARVTDGVGSSGLVELVAAFPPNAAPIVVNPITDIAVNEDAADTVIDLHTVFHDAETADVDLVYSIQANSNPGLVSATVNNTTDALTLHYQTNQFGMASITVRATDAVGLYAEDIFVVTVKRAHDGDAGDLDTGFDPNPSGFASSFPGVSATALQPNGKIVIGGGFTTMSGAVRNHLARLNVDGTLDTGFNADVSGGSYPAVYSVAVLADGKIIIGGAFTNVNGSARNYLARLDMENRLDPSFNPDVSATVSSIAVQPDGQVVIAGGFGVVSGTQRYSLARLNAAGSLDTRFDPNALYGVSSVAAQPDAKLVIGGGFGLVGGTTRRFLARLNPNGSLDTGFNPDVDYGVTSVVVQPDGKIIIGGGFTTVGGVARNRIARLNGNGSLDRGFNPDANDFVYCIALQANGKVIIGGSFTAVGGTPRNRIARLNPDGTFDARFNPDANSFVHSTTVQADGKIIIGGEFTMVGGLARNRIARLENDAATQSLAVPSVSRIEWLRGGSSPEAQDVTFELSTNGGTNWAALGTGTRIAGGWELAGLSLPTNGLVRARARVTGGQYNGSSGLVETVAAFSLSAISSPQLAGLTLLGNGAFQLGFTNLSGATFTALATTNITLPSSNWTVLGPATEIVPGQFQFTDPAATNFPWRFYQIRSP